MVEKSVIQEIIDTFIEDLSNDPSIDGEMVEPMKQLLESGKYNKEDLIRLLKKGKEHEDSQS